MRNRLMLVRVASSQRVYGDIELRIVNPIQLDFASSPPLVDNLAH